VAGCARARRGDGRTVEKGKKVVGIIKDAGGDAAFSPLDVTDENSVHDTIEATVVSRFGADGPRW
jgi:NAD(P)-dependent dehydrogenase (short-subunit alcohol dehydrogenase family)